MTAAFHVAKVGAFTLLPSDKSEEAITRQPDYGSREFTEGLAKKFHQGTKKAIMQARKAGLHGPDR